jgi:hypothetical protein
MALHEFDGEELPWKELQATDETEYGKRVLKGVKSIDWGVFGLSRYWVKDEDGRAVECGRENANANGSVERARL